MKTTSERNSENPNYASDNRLPPQTDGPLISTAFITTDTIRLKVETIERLRSAAGLGKSWDDVIIDLLDTYCNNKTDSSNSVHHQPANNNNNI
ncbi:MAG: antitoxin VapB family protein [Thermoproteota archaeon]|nr:antitoxin VapB family protein [Thermoproteota archaeon]